MVYLFRTRRPSLRSEPDAVSRFMKVQSHLFLGRFKKNISLVSVVEITQPCLNRYDFVIAILNIFSGRESCLLCMVWAICTLTEQGCGIKSLKSMPWSAQEPTLKFSRYWYNTNSPTSPVRNLWKLIRRISRKMLVVFSSSTSLSMRRIRSWAREAQFLNCSFNFSKETISSKVVHEKKYILCARMRAPVCARCVRGSFHLFAPTKG